jgi:ABC-type transporter Mla maintaining outer membrane lipid asymmetry ATPase subunit MlaF
MQKRFQPGPGNLRPLIEVRDLCASYQGNTVFQNVSFEVRRGEILIIAGGSGCGKSTLMKHMIGLYRPERGQILIGGQDIHGSSGAAGRETILRRIGVAYQGGAMFGSLSVLENVKLPLEEFTDLIIRGVHVDGEGEVHGLAARSATGPDRHYAIGLALGFLFRLLIPGRKPD